MRTIPMKAREIKIMELLEKRKAGQITQLQASVLAQISTRQMRRLEKKYTRKGAIGLVHANRGKASPRRFDPEKKKLILQLMKTKYRNFGPTLASELLLEEDGLKISKQSLWRFLIESGYRIKKKRMRIKYRSWRPPVKSKFVCTFPS